MKIEGRTFARSALYVFEVSFTAFPTERWEEPGGSESAYAAQARATRNTTGFPLVTRRAEAAAEESERSGDLTSGMSWYDGKSQAGISLRYRRLDKMKARSIRIIFFWLWTDVKGLV